MQYSNNFIKPTALIAALFFVLSWFFYGHILDLILPTVNRGFYQSAGEEHEVGALILFCFSFALMPVFIAAAWAYSPILSARNRLISAMVILLCVVLGVYLRYQSIRDYFSMMTKGTMFSVAYPYDEIHYDYCILAGLCSGFIISYLFLREKEK